MYNTEFIILILLECTSLIIIVHLWRKRKMPLWQRCLLSALLLVPVLGWLLYWFNAINPESHSDELPERWGSNAPHDS